MSAENNSQLIQRLLKSTQNKAVDNMVTKISEEQTHEITNKILNHIDKGLIYLNSKDSCDNYINHQIKQKALNQIYHSEDYYNYERDLNIMKGIQVSQQLHLPQKRVSRKKVIKQENTTIQKKSSNKIKQEFLQKVKQWQQQRALILMKKQQRQKKRKLLQVSTEQKKKKQVQQINAFLKLEKKKLIENKLRQLDQKKIRRQQQNIQVSSIKKSESLPKYMEVEEKYKSLEKQKQIENKILLKNRKEELELKMKQIKQHQKAYIQRIKQRLQMKSENKDSISKSRGEISKSIESFNINKKDPIELKKIEQKIRRVKKIQNKIRMMPLKIDSEKKKQIEIMGDKLKNKKKYNFLSQKALSDELIYDEFKDFDINIDKKELGNQYFEQFKSKNLRLGKRKVSSQKILPIDKPEYKDYIKQIRQNKSKILNPDEFDSMAKKIKKMKNKQDGKNYLLEKSQHFQVKAMEKIHQLKYMHNYHDAVRKEEQIDKSYMKAIQAKLALAKLQ